MRISNKILEKNLKKKQTIFEFTLSFFQALFKKWRNNKPKLDQSSLLHIFYYTLWYTIIPSLTKRFEMVVTGILRKNLGPPMPKQNDDSCLQGDQESSSTCTFLCPVKLMLRISNFFLYLFDLTLYQK